jgi:hypothetical protein
MPLLGFEASSERRSYTPRKMHIYCTVLIAVPAVCWFIPMRRSRLPKRSASMSRAAELGPAELDTLQVDSTVYVREARTRRN